MITSVGKDWENWNFHSHLVRMWNSIATLETAWQLLRKWNTEAYMTSQPTHRCVPKRTEDISTKRLVRGGSQQHGSWAKKSICPHNGMRFGNQKEWTLTYTAPCTDLETVCIAASPKRLRVYDCAVWRYWHETSRTEKCRHRLPGAGERGKWAVTVHGHWVSFHADEKVLKLDNDSCTTLE